MCVQIFYMMNIDMPASVDAPLLNTQLLLVLNALESVGGFVTYTVETFVL